MMNMLLPWQHEIWVRLWQSKRQNRLPHALLFSGAEGVGKQQFADILTNALLCTSASDDGRACRQCKGCYLFQSKTHPDVRWISPEETSSTIKIDQIRSAVNFVQETALLGGYRVIIIYPASAMNINAANALLKTLEEPTPQTVLILIADQQARLPATVISRCQKIIFPIPPADDAKKWLSQILPDQNTELLLAMSEGAPLRAKQYLETGVMTLRQDFYQALVDLSQSRADPLKCAALWYEKNMEITLALLLVWVNDILRFQLTDGQVGLTNADFKNAISIIHTRISKSDTVKFIDEVQKAYGEIKASLNLNRQLLLEKILIRWVKLCS